MGTCWIPVGYHGKTLKKYLDVFLIFVLGNALRGGSKRPSALWALLYT
jgi:hypothetical protein